MPSVALIASPSAKVSSGALIVSASESSKSEAPQKRKREEEPSLPPHIAPQNIETTHSQNIAPPETWKQVEHARIADNEVGEAPRHVFHQLPEYLQLSPQFVQPPQYWRPPSQYWQPPSQYWQQPPPPPEQQPAPLQPAPHQPLPPSHQYNYYQPPPQQQPPPSTPIAYIPPSIVVTQIPSAALTSLTILDRSQNNWPKWKRRMLQFLGVCGLSGYLTGRITCPDASQAPAHQNWHTNDETVRCLLGLKSAEEEQEFIGGMSTAKDAWDALTTRHEQQGPHAQQPLLHDHHDQPAASAPPSSAQPSLPSSVHQGNWGAAVNPTVGDLRKATTQRPFGPMASAQFEYMRNPHDGSTSNAHSTWTDMPRREAMQVPQEVWDRLDDPTKSVKLKKSLAALGLENPTPEAVQARREEIIAYCNEPLRKRKR